MFHDNTLHDFQGNTKISLIFFSFLVLDKLDWLKFVFFAETIFFWFKATSGSGPNNEFETFHKSQFKFYFEMYFKSCLMICDLQIAFLLVGR